MKVLHAGHIPQNGTIHTHESDGIKFRIFSPFFLLSLIYLPSLYLSKIAPLPLPSSLSFPSKQSGKHSTIHSGIIEYLRFL
jgi:hypothetical protein